jgi:hypothetical protein
MATKYLFVYYPTLGARSLVPNASFNAGGGRVPAFPQGIQQGRARSQGPPDPAQTLAAKPQTHAVNDLEALAQTTRSRPQCLEGAGAALRAAIPASNLCRTKHNCNRHCIKAA